MRCPFCHGIPKSSIYFIQCIDVLYFPKKNPAIGDPPFSDTSMEQGCIIYIYAHAIHDGNIMGLSENLGHLKMIKNCFCIDQP